ncbi:hypothetical protein GKJPGBOP_00375 [Streptomyces paromomycinus]|uniref:Uncharacterized protein n=1 Tax=Streptomyces paromomycinus TaxID=92743 RepID=A0A401VUH9_STREY|nr:hypothetical protein GKJPGBOP_00375 [Streptomyces paromomycinus]
MIGRLNGWTVASRDSLRSHRETASPSVNRKAVTDERNISGSFP